MCRRSRSSSTSSPHVRHAVPSARSQHRTRAPGSQVACRARRPTGARQVDRDPGASRPKARCDPPTPAGARGPRCGFVLIRRAYLVLIMSSTGDRITLSLTLARLAGLRAPLPADNPLRRPRAPLPPHVIASPPNLAYLPIQLMLYKSCSGTLVWNALLCMLCCCTAHGFVVGSKRRASSIARDWRQAPNICT